MGWRVWGERLETGDLTSNPPRVSQSVKFNENVVLRGCRTWIVVQNKSLITLTGLTMKVYSDRAGAPGKLLHTSTKVWSGLSDIITLEHGVKEIYFDWDDPVFKSTDTYHFALAATTYTGDVDNHIAWRRGYPDPVYQTNLSILTTKITVFPFALYFIGSEL